MTLLRTLAAATILCGTAGAAFADSTVAAADAPMVARPASPLVQAFVQDAGIGNQFEMTESQMALAKSQDPHVRAFAQRMLQDHFKAEQSLERAAAPSGVVTHFMFDAGHQAKLDTLDQLTGVAFDQAYWTDQRDAHAAAIAAIGDYATSGSDPALRAWAQETLPVVKDHMAMLSAMIGVSPVAMQ